MLRFLTVLILLGGLAYLANYFFNTSKEAYVENGAFREMNQRPCAETADAFDKHPADEQRKKAEIYLSQLAESQYSVVNLEKLDPEQWKTLKQAFQRECRGNPGLPGEELMARIPREEVLGTGKRKE